jgi:hypothetical protein
MLADLKRWSQKHSKGVIMRLESARRWGSGVEKAVGRERAGLGIGSWALRRLGAPTNWPVSSPTTHTLTLQLHEG